MEAKKGITPVIAIVLLLLITVAAVGVVYSQFQSLTDTNPKEQISRQQRIQNTELTFASVYNNDTDTNSDADSVNITVRNTGQYSVNLTEQFDISFVPSGSDSGLAFSIYPGTVQAESWCFKTQNGNEVLEPGDSYTCKTGVAWPAATESVGIEVSFKNADKSWTHTCAPTTSGSLTC